MYRDEAYNLPGWHLRVGIDESIPRVSREAIS
jgi:hypothetical protein